MKFLKVILVAALILVVGSAVTIYLKDSELVADKFGKSVSSKSLLAIYMVGSDLEDDTNPRDGEADQDNPRGGYATADLAELVKGLKKVDNVEVFVAFGGARTEGWKGVRYADTDCLIEDSKDGRYGNDSCYSFEDRRANMSEEATYQAYLEAAMKKTGNFSRSFLVNWDHGGDYLGFGADTNFDGDILELPEIKNALSASNSAFDIIGFDACLMASVEVANTVEGFTPYLLASEEVEPGHGWQYTEVVSVLSKNDDVIEVGKKLVDSFVDSKSHKATSGKTLSLVDISKLDDLRGEIDNAIAEGDSGSYQAFVEAVDDAEPYGMVLTEFSAYAVDLEGLVRNAEKYSGNDLSDLASSIDQFVIYSKTDGSRPGSSGVSIYSVKNFNIWNSGYYYEGIAATPAWYSGIEGLFTSVSNDTTAPVITDPGVCEVGSEHKYCVQISDDTGLLAAGLANTYQLSGGGYLVYRTESLSHDTSTEFYADQNVTAVFGLCNGEEKECDDSLPIGLNQAKIGDGNIYTSHVIVNGINAMLYLEFDEDGGVSNHFYITYTTSGQRLFPSKEQKVLEGGDTVKGNYRVVDLGTNQMVFQEGSDSITLSNDFGWTDDAVDIDTDKIKLLVYGIDLRGNHTVVSY